MPGPQFPLYAGGARMLESYPVHPLLPDHPLAFGVTSYDGGVFYGITTDRDAVPDADILAPVPAGVARGAQGLGVGDEAAGPAGTQEGGVIGRRSGEEVVSVRRYVPTTLPGLARDWESDGPELTDPVLAEDDSEESEYAALMTGCRPVGRRWWPAFRTGPADGSSWSSRRPWPTSR